MMGTPIDAKSKRFGRPKRLCIKLIEVISWSVLGPVSRNNWKNTFRRGIQKSLHMPNGVPKWCQNRLENLDFLKWSSLGGFPYIVVLLQWKDGSGGFSAPEINVKLKEKRMRKQGLKKVSGIERKRSNNWIQMGARNRRLFEKYRKKCVPNSIRKKVPNGTTKN